MIDIDIVDLSWSPTNNYLATASLDNSIFIYSGTTFGNFKLFYNTIVSNKLYRACT
jgi:WD40 repeat protein